ncbi:MAG: hypothetical protein WAZ36_05525, partial [Sediminibacterium sp.]
MDKIKKIFNFEVKQLGKEEARTLLMVGSTEARDRDGDEIDALGWDLSDYNNNPVIMGFHEYDKFPYARSEKTYIDPASKQLKFEVRFPTIEELTSFPNSPEMIAEHAKNVDLAYNMYRNGYMRAVSVGFIGKEYDPIQENGRTIGRRYKKQSLLELSLVPIPSNPTALMEARSKGIINEKELSQLCVDQNSVTIETQTQEIKIWKCPHCQDGIGEKELFYEDNKWYHRPCKNAGAILLPGTDDEIKSFGQKLFGPTVMKKADPEGNPSVWDIMAAIRLAINPTGIYVSGGPWIDDLYPVNYPSGSVVVEKSEKYFLYQYEYKDGVATLTTEFIELEEIYKPKGFERKSGASLSRKNKEMLDMICRDMGDCEDNLRKFIDTAGMMEDDPMMTAERTAPSHSTGIK